MLGRIICLLLLGLVAARAEVVGMKVGGRVVRIPQPEGFVRYDGKSTKTDAVLASFAPASNRILATFGESSESQSAGGDEFPRLSRSFSAQANREDEEALSPEEFDTVKAALREQLEALKKSAAASMIEVEKSASSAVSQKLGGTLSVKVGDVAPMGVFAETPESLCFLLIVKSRLAGAPLADPIDPSTAIAGCVAHVRDRLLYLYAVSSYDGKPDAEWAREQLVAWRDAIIAINAPGMPEGDVPEPPESDRPWWRRKAPLLIGVAVILLVWWKVRRAASAS